MARISAPPQPGAPLPGSEASGLLSGQGHGPSGKLASTLIAATKPAVEPPSRFPARGLGDGHTTAGLDAAMQQLADKLHPTE